MAVQEIAFKIVGPIAGSSPGRSPGANTKANKSWGNLSITRNFKEASDPSGRNSIPCHLSALSVLPLPARVHHRAQLPQAAPLALPASLIPAEPRRLPRVSAGSVGAPDE